MSINKVRLNTDFLTLYLENDQGLLFNQVEGVLYQLHAITVAFVLALDDGLAESNAIEEISQNCKLSPSELLSEYHKAKALFTSNKPTASYLDGQYPELTCLSDLALIDATEQTTTYLIGESSFAVTCNEIALYREIIEPLKPVAQKLQQVHFKLEIIQVEKDSRGQIFDIFCNDLQVEQNLSFDEVLPVLIDRMQILTFQHSDYHFCFHGAALQTAYGDLLLPGKSGAGKSTLCALLASQNNAVYSDEMIVLDKYFSIKPLSLPIAVKSGSWHVLADKYPELLKAKEWKRIDGRCLKYVWPKEFAESPDKNQEVECLILNPLFCQDNNRVSKEAKKLSVIETIAMLIDGGYQVGVELTEVKLEGFIDFIEKAYCYSFAYQNSEQAETELIKVWGVVNEQH